MPRGRGSGPGRGKGGSAGLDLSPCAERVPVHGLGGRGRGPAAATPRFLGRLPDNAISLTETLPFGVKRIDASDRDARRRVPERLPRRRRAHRDHRHRHRPDHPDLVANLDRARARTARALLHRRTATATARTSPARPPPPLNSVGVVGVAPEARLVAVKVLDDSGNGD